MPREISPPTADPALRLFQAAADDESLHAAVLGSSAHLRVQTATGDDLSLHLRVRDGIADVRVDRTPEVRAAGSAGTPERAEPRAELKASEVRVALAGEGLALGRFESSAVPLQPDEDDGARTAGMPATVSRVAPTASDAPVGIVGSPPADRERPPTVHVTAGVPSGGALGPRLAAANAANTSNASYTSHTSHPGNTGTGRATGYDLGARRSGIGDTASVVAGLAESTGNNPLAPGSSAGANPNLDRHPNPSQTANQAPNRAPDHSGGASPGAHPATGGAPTGSYSSPHQHHPRHPHREGAAETDGVRRPPASAPARTPSTTTAGARDLQTTAIHGDGTPGVHVTA